MNNLYSKLIRNYKHLFLLLAMFHTVVLALFFTYKITHEYNTKKQLIISEYKSINQHISIIISNEMHQIDMDLFLIRSLISKGLSNGNIQDDQYIADTLKDFTNVKTKYDQVRFLDNKGQEVIRINNLSGYANIVPKTELQNKYNRYYFTDTFQLKRNDVFVSPMDLNIENGEIEIPHKPVIRFGTVVFDESGNKRGIVLLNYYGNYLFRMIEDHFSSSHNKSELPVLLNRDGYWIYHKNRTKTFGFMLSHNLSFSETSPQPWNFIRGNTQGVFRRSGDVFVFDTVNFVESRYLSSSGSPYPYSHSRKELHGSEQFWKIVSTVPSAKLNGILKSILEENAVVIAISFLFFMLISHIIAKLVNKNSHMIMALQESEKSAIEANMAKGEFLANMSHEFRTPLNTIISTTNILQDTGLDSTQSEHLRNLQKAGDRMLILVNNVLDISKIEKAYITLKKSEFSMLAMLERIRATQTPKAEEKGLKLSIECDDSIPVTLLGDREKLKKVIINLLDNALKFTDHGTIILKVEHLHSLNMETTIRISLADTGVGMSEEEMQRLFEKFAQADTSSSRKYEGAGLGLTIASELVQLMGGELKVTSIKNSGSVFYFTITLEYTNSAQRSTQTPTEDQLADIDLKECSVLLIDDNEMNLKVCEITLKDLGVQVTTATGGEEALMLFNRYSFDLILTDLQMPGLDGYETTRRIKKINENMPVIALSAAVMETDVERALTAGADCHLEKPLDKEKLKKAIKSSIARARSRLS